MRNVVLTITLLLAVAPLVACTQEDVPDQEDDVAEQAESRDEGDRSKLNETTTSRHDPGEMVGSVPTDFIDPVRCPGGC